VGLKLLGGAADIPRMAAPHRLVLIVAAACLTALTAGIVIGHYALPAHGKAQSSSGTGFAVSAAQADASQATANVRAAVPALEAWNADHGTYEGATLAKLRTQYDYGLHDVMFVFTARDDYCYESRVGDAVASKHGPGGEVSPQPCS
jgi:hypothetical protein